MNPDFLPNLHQNLAFVIMAAAVICALWGFGLWLLHKGINGAFRIALMVTGALGLAQAAIGGILLLSGDRPPDELHYVYGVIVLAALPVAVTYTTGKNVRRDLLWFSIAAFIIFAAGVRAWMTG
jgi:heme A synthase